MRFIKETGKYVILMFETFKRPDKGRVFRRQLMIDFHALGVDSIGIVVFISLFTGGIIAMQMAYNIDNPLVPLYLVGYTTKQMMILEISPTIMSLILAGKVGSSIASEIGTMRVTEQIDALEVMGINSLNYLVFPKIIAMLFYPFIIAIAMFLGIFGGFLAGVYGGFTTAADFTQGLQDTFYPFHLVYAFIKTFFFGMILATVPSWQGFYMKGGALEVGKASTNSFVWTSIIIILTNYIITQLLLS